MFTFVVPVKSTGRKIGIESTRVFFYMDQKVFASCLQQMGYDNAYKQFRVWMNNKSGSLSFRAKIEEILGQKIIENLGLINSDFLESIENFCFYDSNAKDDLLLDVPELGVVLEKNFALKSNSKLSFSKWIEVISQSIEQVFGKKGELASYMDNQEASNMGWSGSLDYVNGIVKSKIEKIEFEKLLENISVHNQALSI